MGATNSTPHVQLYNPYTMVAPESEIARWIRDQLGLSRDEFKQFLTQLFALGASGVLSYYIMKMAMESINGANSKERAGAEAKLKKLGRLDKKQSLTAHETMFAQKVALRELKPDNFEDVRFDGLGGLDDEIEAIKQAIMRPIQRRKLLQCNIDSQELSATLKNYTATMGLLLYGPPGTGKTALVKAVAAELDAAFMPIDISQIMDKYVGESNKYVTAIFSLAAKLAPCVIFLDEVDAVFGNRAGAGAMVVDSLMLQLKSQFLAHWDGLESKSDHIVLVGATNRPQALDPAFLRRFATKLHIPQPNAEQLTDIFKKKFNNNDMSEIEPEQWQMLGNFAHHYDCTGADVKLIRDDLARRRIDSYVSALEQHHESNSTDATAPLPELEKLTMTDLRDAIHRIGRQKTATL